jgi:hypothetical protein
MLDVLEAGVAALRSNSGHVSPQNAGVVSPEELRASMAEWSLSASEIANALSVPRERVEEWLGGQAAIPSWAPVTIQVIARLTPPGRRKLQNGAAYHTKAETETKSKSKSKHPFSRIEEL